MKHSVQKWLVAGSRLAVLGFMSLLSGCGGAVSLPELVGRYVFSCPTLTDELMLSSDGKFMQTVVYSGSNESLRADGTWKFDATGQRVTFDEAFVNVADDLGRVTRIPRHVSTNKPVQKWAGQVSIGGDPGIQYLRR